MLKRLITIYTGLLLALPAGLAQSDFCLSARDGFQQGITRYVYEDRDANIWICSSTGLYKWDGADLHSADPAHFGDMGAMLRKGINRIHQDQTGDYWLSTQDNGLLKYDRQRDTLRQLTPETAGMTRYWDIVEDGDVLWIGGKGGLLQVARTGPNQTFFPFTLEDHGVDGPIIRAVMQDPENQDLLWVGGTFGLATFSKRAGGFTLIPQPVGTDDWYPGDRVLMIANLHRDDDHIYGASWGGGLLRYDIADGSWDQFLFEQDSTADAPLDDNICQYIIPVNDTMLALSAWRHCPILFNVRSSRFITDAANPFLATCRSGGFSEGLLHDRTGRLWMGYFNQICALYEFRHDTPPPPIRIAGIYEEGTPPQIFGSPPEGELYTFGRYQRDLVISVATGSMFPPAGREYRLNGYDQRWHPLDRPVLRYTQLPGGNLTFNVRQLQPDGSREIVLSQKLRIQPLLHEYPWFWPAVLIPSLALLYYLIWLRTRYRREKELMEVQYQKRVLESELAALRAQMNPHFVFNGLNSIRNYIFKQDTDAASEYLTMFSRLIRAILQNSQSQLIPLSEDLDALSLYLDIEARRFKDEFAYSIDIDADLDPDAVYVPPMLIQPYVENAIWHGLRLKEDKRILNVKVEDADGNVRIVVSDNGIGRAAAAVLNQTDHARHQSLGMPHTAERIQLMKEMLGREASVRVEDLNVNGETGTRVILTLPMITEHQLPATTSS